MTSRSPATTIIFAAVSGEEQGPFGSDHMAKVLKAAASGVGMQGMLDNDIRVVGSSTGDDGTKAPSDPRMIAKALDHNVGNSSPNCTSRRDRWRE